MGFFPQNITFEEVTSFSIRACYTKWNKWKRERQKLQQTYQLCCDHPQKAQEGSSSSPLFTTQIVNTNEQNDIGEIKWSLSLNCINGEAKAQKNI